MRREKAILLRKMIERASASLTDIDALTVVELFPHWNDSADYITGDRVSFNNSLFKCLQSHAAQPSWTPDLTPALWSVVTLDEYPQWIQPTGTQDAYNEGDKVSHNDKHWISTVNANVWEPGVYGWVEEGV